MHAHTDRLHFFPPFFPPPFLSPPPLLLASLAPLLLPSSPPPCLPRCFPPPLLWLNRPTFPPAPALRWLRQPFRYGLIGQNGCGKSTFLECLAAREVPIPEHMDIYLLAEEAPPTDLSAMEVRTKTPVPTETLVTPCAISTSDVPSPTDPARQKRLCQSKPLLLRLVLHLHPCGGAPDGLFGFSAVGTDAPPLPHPPNPTKTPVQIETLVVPPCTKSTSLRRRCPRPAFRFFSGGDGCPSPPPARHKRLGQLKLYFFLSSLYRLHQCFVDDGCLPPQTRENA